MGSLRNHYLHTMGIEVWQSREILPGAKLETDILVHFEELDDSTLEIKEAFTSIVSEEAGTPVVSLSADSLVPTLPGINRASTEPELGTESGSNATGNPLEIQPEILTEQGVEADQSPNPEFRIASIVFPGACVVVTEVPVQTVEPITSEHLVFLNELLLAINAPIVDKPVVTLFNWPMLRSVDFDQSAVAACEASQAFLQGQKSKHSLGFILLMGEVPGQFLLSEGGTFSEKIGCLHGPVEQPRLLTHSIEKIFSEPELKGQVWHDLQLLVTREKQD